MKCQKCNKNEANTHYTQIINGKKKEYFLCSECANGSQEINSLKLGFDNEFDSFNNFFSGFLSSPYIKSKGISESLDTCDLCHMSFSEFLQDGRLGCSKCYENFESKLINPLKQIHSSTTHIGKVPQKAGEELKKTRKLEKLENELKEAISVQNFERAAELRDIINEIKKGA